jgi:hypothetical protein
MSEFVAVDSTGRIVSGRESGGPGAETRLRHPCCASDFVSRRADEPASRIGTLTRTHTQPLALPTLALLWNQLLRNYVMTTQLSNGIGLTDPRITYHTF